MVVCLNSHTGLLGPVQDSAGPGGSVFQEATCRVDGGQRAGLGASWPKARLRSAAPAGGDWTAGQARPGRGFFNSVGMSVCCRFSQSEQCVEASLPDLLWPFALIFPLGQM